MALDNRHQDRRLLARACGCADHILSRYLGVAVAKARGLDSPEDFDVAVVRLADALRARAAPCERDAVAAAARILDVDWSVTTSAQRRELVAQAVAAARGELNGVPQRLRSTFERAASRATSTARQHARTKEGLNLGKDFSALDRRMMAFMTRSHTLFVRDASGRRLDHFSNKAREIVAQGMAAGLGRDQLAADLYRAAEGTLAARGSAYWEVVAGAFVGRGRAYAQVGAYAEVGIKRYRIEAVLDERTSNVCRFMHGRVFNVAAAVRQFQTAERADAPDDIKAISPWLRESNGRLFITRGGRRVNICTVVRSGVGTVDDRGEFSRDHSSSTLMSNGFGFPPYHGLCRTYVTAFVM